MDEPKCEKPESFVDFPVLIISNAVCRQLCGPNRTFTRRPSKDDRPARTSPSMDFEGHTVVDGDPQCWRFRAHESPQVPARSANPVYSPTLSRAIYFANKYDNFSNFARGYEFGCSHIANSCSYADCTGAGAVRGAALLKLILALKSFPFHNRRAHCQTNSNWSFRRRS